MLEDSPKGDTIRELQVDWRIYDDQNSEQEHDFDVFVINGNEHKKLDFFSKRVFARSKTVTVFDIVFLQRFRYGGAILQKKEQKTKFQRLKSNKTSSAMSESQFKAHEIFFVVLSF